MPIIELKLANRLSAAQRRAYRRLNAETSFLRASRAAALINGYEKKIAAMTAGAVRPYNDFA